MHHSLFYKLNDLLRQKTFILLTLDKAFQFLSQLLIVSVYRKYIGLSNYADFVFALVFFTVLSTISFLGMDRLLLEKFSRENKLANWNKLMFSSIFYKLILSGIIIVGIKLFESVAVSHYGENFVCILFIISLGLIGQVYMILDSFCQAKKKNEITIKSRITVLLLINIVRFSLLTLIDNSFYFFLWTFPAEQALYLLFSLYYGRRYFSKIFKYINYHYESIFLRSGLMYTISTLLIIFQMKYVFSVVKINLSKEFYEYYSIASYLCDITFSVPALLSLFYRPDLARNYVSNIKIFRSIFLNFCTNMFTLSILANFLICAVLFLIFTFTYKIDFLFALPLYLFSLIVPLFFFAYIIQVLQLICDSFRNFLLGSVLGSLIVYFVFNIVIEYVSKSSIVIVITYLALFFVTQILIPLFLERKNFNFIFLKREDVMVFKDNNRLY